ncbi:LOW QUALITY PROTEIN: sialin-like [Panulirus ornatus]|uniref:LOW QUALITY PROTEIN: sialin-like n=1 Tax=Panulirus ornatus TaxID=150431 RepID=UPI003A864404
MENQMVLKIYGQLASRCKTKWLKLYSQLSKDVLGGKLRGVRASGGAVVLKDIYMAKAALQRSKCGSRGSFFHSSTWVGSQRGPDPPATGLGSHQPPPSSPLQLSQLEDTSKPRLRKALGMMIRDRRQRGIPLPYVLTLPCESVATALNHISLSLPTGCFPVRYLVAMLAFLGIMCNYLLRVNITFTIVAMVKYDVNALTNHNTTLSPTLNATVNGTLYSDVGREALEGQADLAKDVCPAPHDHSQPLTSYSGDLPWDEWTQGLVNGAFFYGNIWTQLPGGRVAEMWGPRRVLGGSLLSAALLTLLQPVAAKASYILLILIRILVGFSLGVTSPSIQVLISGWAPPMERSTLSSLIYAGAPAGTLVAFPVSAFIIEVMGWEAVFYLQGLLTLAWCMVWFFVMTDTPENFRWISHQEKHYITSSIGNSKSKKARNMPWRAVLTSMPVWAVVVASVGNNWGFYSLLSAVPLYAKTVLQQDIKTNASLSGLPYLGMWVMTLGAGVVSDWFLQRGYASTGAVRKASNILSNIGPALCLLGLMWVGCHVWATVALLMLAITIQGAVYSAHYVNPLDLSPNFAGTLCGITNTLANIPGFLAPMTNGFFINNQQTLTQWRKVFGTAAALYVLNTIFYLIFASGEEQPWNNVQPEHTQGGGEEGAPDNQDKTCHQREDSNHNTTEYQEEADNPTGDRNHNSEVKGPHRLKSYSGNCKESVTPSGKTSCCVREGTQVEEKYKQIADDTQPVNCVSYRSIHSEDSRHEGEISHSVDQREERQDVVAPTEDAQGKKGYVNPVFSTEE